MVVVVVEEVVVTDGWVVPVPPEVGGASTLSDAQEAAARQAVRIKVRGRRAVTIDARYPFRVDLWGRYRRGMDYRPVDDEMAGLLLGNRWAALALAPAEGPVVAMVGYAVEPGLGGILLFLSGLAAHTGTLRKEARAALAVSAPDLGAGDPQELPRLTLEGPVEAVGRDVPEFARSWPVYAARFPAAVPRLGLADFALFRLVPVAGRYVGGFARAVDVSPGRLAAAVSARQSG